MTCRLHEGTTLTEMLLVAHSMPADEQEQYEAFTGLEYVAEDAAAKWYMLPGPKWTIYGDGTPIVVAGFVELRPGVWQDWLFSTPTAWTRHWRSVTKHCRRVMDGMLQGPAHRLQCISLASRVQAHRWYRTLRLEREATIHAYGVNGEDAVMFYRLRGTDG